MNIRSKFQNCTTKGTKVMAKVKVFLLLWTDGQTDEQTDGRTDGQVKNYMPPNLRFRGHKNNS